MCRLILVIACVLIAAESSIAGSKQDGGLPGCFLNLAANARTSGMGCAGVADEKSGMFFNPASLSYRQEKELCLMSAEPFPESNYTLFSYLHPLTNWSLGLGFVGNKISGAEYREAGTNKPQAGTFDDTNRAIFLAGAWPVLPWLSLGINLKSVSKEFIETSENSLGFDLGVLLVPSDNLQFGLCLQNLLPPEFSRNCGNNDTFPINMRAGMAVGAGDNITINLDLARTSESSAKLHLGGEYAVSQLLSLRAGYDQGNLTTGLGVKLRGVFIDYAVTNKEYKPTHQVSLTIRFN